MIKQKYSLKKQKGSAKAKKGRKNESKKVCKEKMQRIRKWKVRIDTYV